MIIKLQDKRDLKVELERTWVRLNDLKVTAFFIKEERGLVSDAKILVNKLGKDIRHKNLTESVAELEKTISRISFGDLEESITAVQEIIDREFFGDTLFQKHIEAKDDDEDEYEDKDEE